MELTDYLGIYLDDHRAAAAGGLALARRIADEHGDQPGFESVHELAEQVAADVDEFDRLRDRLDYDGGQLKRLLAVVGEQVGRLKLNGRLLCPSPLSPVEEIEGMSAGVFAKRRLWLTLLQLSDEPALDEYLERTELERLVERADDQLRMLDEVHTVAIARLARS